MSNRDQIQNVVSQMREVLSNRNTALRKMLNENERVTRETVQAELEVKNYTAMGKRLRDEIVRLEKDLKQAQARGERTQELVVSARAKSRLVAKENTSLTSSTKKLGKEVNQLRSATTKLEDKVAQLEAKRDQLNADTVRLQDLKAKYLSELAKFKA